MRYIGYLFLFSGLFGQSSTYLGPKSPEKGLIRVEVLVQDSPELGGLKIDSASFNGESIPLKPSDVNGYRGGASFQVPPGVYKLIWVVLRDKTYWPRKITHESTVSVSSKDTWVQVSIQGEEASIR